MKWVKVKDALPEEREIVLAYNEKWSGVIPVELTIFFGGASRFYTLEQDCELKDQPTHWQPLPPPPSSHNSDYAAALEVYHEWVFLRNGNCKLFFDDWLKERLNSGNPNIA